jgi:hypothetical protein
MRPLILALLSLALVAPAARAEVTDKLPVLGASDGVRLTLNARAGQLRFGAKAAKLYRDLSGRRAVLVCGYWEDGGPDTVITHAVLPRRRSSARLRFGGRPDVCALATPRRNADQECPLMRVENPEHCTKVIVAMTDRGRVEMDALARSYDLLNADFQLQGYPRDWMPPLEWLDGSVRSTVALPTPDASPPAGKLGYWHESETSYAIVTLLADGSRRFLRRSGDVVSTNDPRLLGQSLTVF